MSCDCPCSAVHTQLTRSLWGLQTLKISFFPQCCTFPQPPQNLFFSGARSHPTPLIEAIVWVWLQMGAVTVSASIKDSEFFSILAARGDHIKLTCSTAPTHNTHRNLSSATYNKKKESSQNALQMFRGKKKCWHPLRLLFLLTPLSNLNY